ncbi:NACHT domain-containing protein [Streptomyces sp. NPDC054838]
MAEQVKEDEQRQWRQLIGDDTKRINVAFKLRPEPGRTALTPADTGRLFAGTPTLPDVAAYYRQTRPRRLVVTGAAGAGKTVLALELMLALLEDRDERDPVPVRLSLAEWDTAIALPAWVARHLVDVYDWPTEMAEELVRQRRVLPVLDGLDEMDPTRPDGAPSRNAPRAQAALNALNDYQDGRTAGPVVLTCRTRHYKALGSQARLLDAAHIQIQHVTPSTARSYLMQRARDPARWQSVLDALDSDPTCTLARALSTPWRLSLAATVYAQHGDPSDLLRHARPNVLVEHLLARFIRAAVALHPRQRRSYDARIVHQWLAELASHVSPRTDLVLHQLWPMAGPRRVRRTDALLTTLTVLLPLPLAWASSSPWGIALSIALTAVVAGSLATVNEVAPPKRVGWGGLRTEAGYRNLVFGLGFGLANGLVLGLDLGLLLGLVSGPDSTLVICSIAALLVGLHLGLLYLLWAGPTLPPSVPLLGACVASLIFYASVLGLVVALVLGLILWFMGGSMGLIRSWLAFGLGFGLTVGLALGLLTAITHGSAVSSKPREMVRGDLVCGIAGGLACGLAGGLTFGLAFGTAGGLTFGLAFGTAGGLTGCLTGGLAGDDSSLSRSGLQVGGTAGRRYLVFLLCSKGKLPWRLGAFLDWAYAAGLLRLAGAAYQFRHRELQQWLERNPGPPPV